MKTILTISRCTQEGDQMIRFGVPEDPQEVLRMHQLRYHVYVEKKGYIPASFCPNGVEIDHIDQKGGCSYLIAQCGDALVGSVRMSHQKMEIGRLVADRPLGMTIPSGLIPLGLIRCATLFCFENNVHAAYANLKMGLAPQLERWRLPVHRVDSYEFIYDEASEDPLKNYFKDPNDAACPVYFFTKEVARFYDQLLWQDVPSGAPLRASNSMKSISWKEDAYARTF